MIDMCYKKTFMYGLHAMLALGAGAAMVSCADDLTPDSATAATDVVCFSAGPASWGDAADTRSGHRESTAGAFVLRSSDSADTLCVQVTETDGILPGGSPATRGVPVSAAEGVSSFGCLAYTSQGGVDKFYIKNEEYVRGGNGVYGSANLYYWPGSQLSLDFYNIAPFGAQGLTLPEESSSRSVSYTVPEAAADQNDLMIAVNPGVKGDNNAAVPLNFRHLLSAVRIVAGQDMMPGTIKSVRFSNLCGSAKIDMDNIDKGWYDLSARECAYEVGEVAVSGGTAGAGQGIADGESTFMMLPQSLESDEASGQATLTVTFDEGNGKPARVLTAPLTGTWEMGKTYTYRLSVTPEYELDFAETPFEVDAHYLIVPIKVKADQVDGSWKLESANTDACKLRMNLVGPEENGYWPKENTGDGDFKREAFVTSSTLGTVTVYAFLTENTTGAPRDITLNLYGSANDAKPHKTITITQQCPDANGWEQIEESPARPYGFNWDRKVTYETKPLSGQSLYLWVIEILRYSNSEVVKFNRWALPSEVTIDYGKIPNLTNTFDANNGLTNTINLNKATDGDIINLDNTLNGWLITKSESGGNIDTVEFAALECIKKNPCNVERKEQSSGGDTQVAYSVSFSDSDVKWYLPARDEFATAPMAGTYWTSTAIQAGNDRAYSWQNGTAVETARMAIHRVRAKRTR